MKGTPSQRSFLMNGVILAIGGLAAVERLAVLADDDVLGLDSRDGAKDADLLVTNILGVEGNRSLHSQESENLKKMVLHNITNDTKLVKVTSTSLGTKWLLECDLNVVDVVSVPRSAEERVTKSKDQDVLDHLLTKVMVNSEQLLLVPIRLEGLLKLTGAGKILAERLLDLVGLLAIINMTIV
ncbi:hypothetical protein HG531_013375 [Fusarium graminearum]|nr:hypothetical protein HG531_013375 [Fusarium graminearum]